MSNSADSLRNEFDYIFQKKRWIKDIDSDVIRQCPFRVTPYVFGAILREQHLRPLAEALCPPGLIELQEHDYHAALVLHMFGKGVEQTFVPVWNGKAKERVYIWTLAIVPGYDGRRPPATLMPEQWVKFLNKLRRLGISDDLLESIRAGSAPYPEGLAYPVWLPRQLEAVVKSHMEEREAIMTAQAKAGKVVIDPLKA